jgi:phage gp45-like
MIFSGLLTKIKNAGKTLQIRYLFKTKDNVRNLNPYGFFSNPPENSKVVLLKDKFGSVYGIAYLDSSIPVLNGNEVVVGNFVEGSQILFKTGGKIQIKNTETDLLTLMTELKTILKTGKIDSGTFIFDTATQTAIDTWFTNIQKLLTT